MFTNGRLELWQRYYCDKVHFFKQLFQIDVFKVFRIKSIYYVDDKVVKAMKKMGPIRNVACSEQRMAYVV